MKIERTKEYITTILCLFGFHKLSKKENGSKFINEGGWSFGWEARWVRECQWCRTKIYSKPFLKSDRDKLIEEAINYKKL